MRIVLFAVALTAPILFSGYASHAYYYSYYYGGPWCAVESLGFSTVKENCSMRSFEQCRLETIAGNRGYCTPNPRWTGPQVLNEQVQRSHKRRLRRH